MTDPSSEPFFSGPGLDRADSLRADDEAIRRLSTGPSARQLRWLGGLPHLTAEGRLEWEPALRPELFLGFDAGDARFSAIEHVTADARAAFPLMA
ncbi:MAG TPA: hypothetical protein VM711_04285, partial [Sphingomicrobium sp.]|nr:hypothetical protein [Sphingomicrobium sp.]